MIQFHQKIFEKLGAQFPWVRRIRGDGNCYYRAVYMAYLEFIILRANAPDLILDLIGRIHKRKGLWDMDTNDLFKF